MTATKRKPAWQRADALPAAATPPQVDTRVPPKAARVVSRVAVNGVEIAEADILAEAQNHPAENPGAAVRAAARALAVRELLVQQARREGVEAEPETDGDGRPETAADAAIRVLMERAIDVPSAGEAECRRYYENHPQKFRTEPLYEARHILIAKRSADPAALAIARDRAKRLCDLLADDPGRFSALARNHSDCPSKEQGGNLGQIGRGGTVAEFEAALEAMDAGEIGREPVESRFGFHVIALDRRIEGRDMPFEMVTERIAAWLEAAAWSKAVSQYIAMLAGRAEIEGIDLEAADGPLVQ